MKPQQRTPRRQPAAAAWAAWAAVLLPLLVLIVLRFAGSCVGGLIWYGKTEPHETLTMLMTYGAGVLIFLLWYRLLLPKRQAAQDSRDGRHRRAAQAAQAAQKQDGQGIMPYFLAVYFGLLGVFFAHGISCGEQLIMPDYAQNTGFAWVDRSDWAALVTHLLLVPVCEELVFRGVTARYAARAAWLSGARAMKGRFLLTAVVQSLLYALLHMNLVESIYLFFLGLVLMWLSVRFGSILPAMAGHITFTSIIMLGLDDVLLRIPVAPLYTLLLLLIPAGLALLMIFIYRTPAQPKRRTERQ